MSRRKDVRIPNPHRAANEEQNLQNKRLKSLYDAIDAGRNKDSIELADKIVRKFGGKDRNNLNDKITVNTAQALKALASIRLENSFTADAAVLVENCEQAITSGEFNEGTLQVLFHCFKESYIPNRIPLLIEKILKVQKPSEGLLLDLYFGYARVMDFKNQQRVANMLYKDYENWKYLFWVINNIVMQANNSPLAEKVYYPLAQRMLEKLAADGGDRKPNRTEIVLNHQVLTQRRDYQKAFDYLNRVTANGSLNKEDAKNMRFELLKLSERFDDLFSFIAEEVKTDALNFGAWETLFWIYEHANKKEDEELKKRAVEQFDQLNREFLPDTNANAKHYGYLLKLLFYKQINKLGDSEKAKELTAKLGKVVDNLKKMISLTHERPNSYSDISKFLHMLPTSEHAQLVEFINTEFSSQLEDNSDLFYVRELLQTAFGFHRQKSVSERTQYALKLVESLNSNAENDKHLDQHAKAVTLIISNVLWDNYVETGSNQHLYELTALLEFIFDRCPNVFIAALVLMRIYTKIGGINRIVALYNQLDIKFFQRDSLGYLTFASAMQFGRFREAIFYFTGLTSQFDHNERETSEAIVTANRACSLDQIQYLVEFSEHCRSSIYATGADILNQLLSSCFAVESLNYALLTLRGDEERIDWSRVTDSRDFGVIEQMALADERVTEKVKKLGFEETLDYVKLIYALGRAISNTGVANLAEETFDADLSALRAHLAYCKSYYTKSELSTYLQGFGVPQLVSLVNQPFLDPILDLLQLASRICSAEKCVDTTETFNQLVQIATELSKQTKFDGLVTGCRLQSESISEFLERGTHCLVAMSLTAILIKFMEARVGTLLPKLKANLTLEKIEKASVQQQEITDFMANLRLTTDSEQTNGVEEKEATNTSQGKKSKKSKQKPFEELNEEQKIAASFKLAQKNLLTTCREIEILIAKNTEQLKSTKTFFQDGVKSNFSQVKLESYVDYVDQTLTESHSRSLDDLRTYTSRIQFFSTMPRFNLLNIQFAGSVNVGK